MKRKSILSLVLMAIGVSMFWLNLPIVVAMYDLLDLSIAIAESLIQVVQWISFVILSAGIGLGIHTLVTNVKRWIDVPKKSEETKKLKKVVEKAEDLAKKSTKDEINLETALINIRDIGIGLQDFVEAYLTGHIRNITKVTILNDIIKLLEEDPINLLTLAGLRAELQDIDEVLARQLKNPQLWGARYKTHLLEQLYEARIFAKKQADQLEAEADAQRAIIAGASIRIETLTVKQTKERAGKATQGLLISLQQTETIMEHIPLIQPERQLGQGSRGAFVDKLPGLSLFTGEGGQQPTEHDPRSDGRQAVRVDQLKERLHDQEA